MWNGHLGHPAEQALSPLSWAQLSGLEPTQLASSWARFQMGSAAENSGWAAEVQLSWIGYSSAEHCLSWAGIISSSAQLESAEVSSAQLRLPQLVTSTELAPAELWLLSWAASWAEAGGLSCQLSWCHTPVTLCICLYMFCHTSDVSPQNWFWKWRHPSMTSWYAPDVMPSIHPITDVMPSHSFR